MRSIPIFLALLCTLLSGSPGWAKDRQKTQKKSDGIVLVGIGEKGKAYRDCSRKNQDILICLEGNGFYNLETLSMIQKTDWFKNDFLARSQVEEIRFVCSDKLSEASNGSASLKPGCYKTRGQRNADGTFHFTYEKTPCPT